MRGIRHLQNAEIGERVRRASFNARVAAARAM
jgi:hypothetical protein